jgi:hypothetical protein
MSQYGTRTDGSTATLTNGSAAVVIAGGTLLGRVKAGQLFTRDASGTPYFVASDPVDNINITLTSNWNSGSVAGASWHVQTGRTTNLGLDYPEADDLDQHTSFKAAMNKLDTFFSALITGVAGAVLFLGSAGAIGADAAKFSWDDTNGALSIASGTQTTSHPLLVATQTWNAGGVTFTAVDLNVTNTASASGSLLANLRVGGTSQWKVDKAGNVTQTGTLGATGNAAFGGATFSTWTGTVGKAIEVGAPGCALFCYSQNETDLHNNVYYNSGYKFAGSGYASLYSQASGVHAWYTSSAAGTAGNAASMNTLMSLGVNGALNIISLAATVRESILLSGSTTAANYITISNTGAVGRWGIESSAGTALISGGTAYATVFGSNNATDLILFTNGTARLRIDSAGGHNFPEYINMASTKDIRWNGGDASIVNSGTSLLFKTYTGAALTTKLTIAADGQATHAGNVIMSSAAAGVSALSVTQTANGGANALSVINSAATATNQYGLDVTLSGDPNNTGNYFFIGSGNVTARFVARSNGGLANFSANNVNLSDLSVKPHFELYADIGLMPSLWNAHKQMRGAWGRFKYGDQTHDDWNFGYGAQLVAQAFAGVADELVDWWDEEKKLKAVYATDLANITGAIVTESQHRIDDLMAWKRSAEIALKKAGITIQ